MDTHRKILDDLFESGIKLFNGIYSMRKPDYEVIDDEVIVVLSGMPRKNTVVSYVLHVRPDRIVGRTASSYRIDIREVFEKGDKVVAAQDLRDFLINAKVDYVADQKLIQFDYDSPSS